MLLCFLQPPFLFLCCGADILLLALYDNMNLYACTRISYMDFCRNPTEQTNERTKGLIATACACDKQTIECANERVATIKRTAPKTQYGNQTLMAHHQLISFPLRFGFFVRAIFSFDLINAHDRIFELCATQCGHRRMLCAPNIRPVVGFCLVTWIQSR